MQVQLQERGQGKKPQRFYDALAAMKWASWIFTTQVKSCWPSPIANNSISSVFQLRDGRQDIFATIPIRTGCANPAPNMSNKHWSKAGSPSTALFAIGLRGRSRRLKVAC